MKTQADHIVETTDEINRLHKSTATIKFLLNSDNMTVSNDNRLSRFNAYLINRIGFLIETCPLIEEELAYSDRVLDLFSDRFIQTLEK